MWGSEGNIPWRKRIVSPVRRAFLPSVLAILVEAPLDTGGWVSTGLKRKLGICCQARQGLTRCPSLTATPFRPRVTSSVASREHKRGAYGFADQMWRGDRGPVRDLEILRGQ